MYHCNDTLPDTHTHRHTPPHHPRCPITHVAAMLMSTPTTNTQQLVRDTLNTGCLVLRYGVIMHHTFLLDTTHLAAHLLPLPPGTQHLLTAFGKTCNNTRPTSLAWMHPSTCVTNTNTTQPPHNTTITQHQPR